MNIFSFQPDLQVERQFLFWHLLLCHLQPSKKALKRVNDILELTHEIAHVIEIIISLSRNCVNHHLLTYKNLILHVTLNLNICSKQLYFSYYDNSVSKWEVKQKRKFADFDGEKKGNSNFCDHSHKLTDLLTYWWHKPCAIYNALPQSSRT